MWFSTFTAAQLNNRPKNHLGGLLDIQFTEVGEDFLTATMPVDERTHQPAGILHGGASVVLAETLGSIASYMCVDPEKYMAVGLEINANHLRPVKSGLVTGICKPLHIGAKTHVWEIKIYNDKGKMNCISRLTVAVIPKPQG
ncbi:1,4-dihydroxy-2-naphthoyl-CoA hydrolase [Pedobacter steynii]|uniref:1,4-dihydroxy-2-naphthoyl-CoA hydrolase n=1 Tax=Pedobacter steynii TaxID=430522 RepID=A0A1H0DXP6_9SPHI|nr:hotdog fold thioesterase [Pedobacter steynii]NQX41864.1 hotdog fold thioesterase [Pedobacter steynii]SDN74879.1 1,4-dihydroxy-2-naphthoyl-CoA hydrolase [Pedobacter steynii]